MPAGLATTASQPGGTAVRRRGRRKADARASASRVGSAQPRCARRHVPGGALSVVVRKGGVVCQRRSPPSRW
eukprot:365424-Chlamydomonas_euryale.AAC.29